MHNKVGIAKRNQSNLTASSHMADAAGVNISREAQSWKVVVFTADFALLGPRFDRHNNKCGT
jgi:hypothetical protein